MNLIASNKEHWKAQIKLAGKQKFTIFYVPLLCIPQKWPKWIMIIFLMTPLKNRRFKISGKKSNLLYLQPYFHSVSYRLKHILIILKLSFNLPTDQPQKIYFPSLLRVIYNFFPSNTPQTHKLVIYANHLFITEICKMTPNNIPKKGGLLTCTTIITCIVYNRFIGMYIHRLHNREEMTWPKIHPLYTSMPKSVLNLNGGHIKFWLRPLSHIYLHE